MPATLPELDRWQGDFVAALDRPRLQHSALKVYRNTALKGAIEALADNYPTIAMLVGHAAFLALARGFVARHPPASPVLARYGAGFDRWLARHPIATDLPYLADVARIDRLHTEAHLAGDADILDAASLSGLTADQWSLCRLRLHPATRFAWFAVPAPDIWLAHRHPDLAELNPEWRPQGILLTRPHGGVQPLVIDAGLHAILAALQRGSSVGAAAVKAARAHPETCITDAFCTLLTSGAVAALTPGIEP